MSEEQRVTRKLYKQRQALALRTRGMSYDDIAQELNITRDEAIRLVQECLHTTPEVTYGDTVALRQLEASRLDVALQAIWSQVETGNLGAINTLLKISARRARLLGLDMPERHFLQATTAGVDELFGGKLVQELVGLSWDERSPEDSEVSAKMLPESDEAAIGMLPESSAASIEIVPRVESKKDAVIQFPSGSPSWPV